MKYLQIKLLLHHM